MTELEKSVFTKIVELQRNVLRLDQNSFVYEDTLSVINDGLDRLIKLIDSDESDSNTETSFTDSELESMFVNNLPDNKDTENENVSAQSSSEHEVSEFDTVTADYPTDIDEEVLGDNLNETSTQNIVEESDNAVIPDSVLEEKMEENVIQEDASEDQLDETYMFTEPESDSEHISSDSAQDEKPTIEYSNLNDEKSNGIETDNSKPKVDEILSRHVSKDIFKAFTINDKFRYRRALFGNNTQQYNDALNLISQMDSYEEAEDYFLNNYGWNPEDGDVKGFLKILEHHFNA